MQKFKAVGITTDMAFEIMVALKEEEQQKKMMQYLEDNKDIITDHQAEQHAIKILQGRR